MKKVFFLSFLSIAAFVLLSAPFFSTNRAHQMKSFFQASQKQPFHLSIGAVLFDP